jgi:putative mycofactocin binding protein MftB
VSTRTFDLEGAWELHPSVAVRPERFGALLYHFGTRRLSFLKTPMLLDAVNALAERPTARAALDAAGVDERQYATYAKALAGLAASDMIRPRAVA